MTDQKDDLAEALEIGRLRTDFLAGTLFGLFVAAVTLTFHFDRMNRIERQAIERGYALYCPTTGDYVWKGECDD